MAEPNTTESSAATDTVCLVTALADTALADTVQRELRERLPSVEVQQAASVAAIQEAVVEWDVDLLVVQFSLPDGSCLDVLRMLDRADLAVPVLVITEAGEEQQALDALTHGAVDYWMWAAGTSVRGLPLKVLDVLKAHRRRLAIRRREQRQRQLLHEIRTAISAINHEINNPLAIISGNAQLLLELSRMMDLDDAVVHPIEDIDHASRRVAELLNKLRDLRDKIKEPTAGADTDD